MTETRIVHLSTVHQTRDNRIYNKQVPALLQAGYDATLVIRADADEAEPVPLVALPTPRNRIERLTKTQVHAWRALNRLKPTILQIHDPELIPLAWAWARLHKARCIFDSHEELVKQVDSKAYLRSWQMLPIKAYAHVLNFWADKGMDAIVTATETIADGFRNPNTEVVHNYPLLDNFSAEPAPVPGRMVYVGDLSEERKLSFMLDVTRRVRQQVPEAHLVLAGRIVADGEPAMAARDSEAVEYLGLLRPTEVPAVIASAQVGLLFFAHVPNHEKALPNKLFEYMAAGVPFAATDMAFWMSEFGPLDAGAFVDSDDAAATASALIGLLRDPSRCAELGANGRRAVHERFTFASQAEILVNAVERLRGGA